MFTKALQLFQYLIMPKAKGLLEHKLNTADYIMIFTLAFSSEAYKKKLKSLNWKEHKTFKSP